MSQKGKKCYSHRIKLCSSPSGGVPGAPGEEQDEQQDHGVRDAEAEKHGAGALGDEVAMIREPL